jgi:MFS family permease
VINRRFTLLWAAQTVSELGNRVSDLALPLIAVVTLGAGPLQVGLLTSALWAPNLLGVLVGSWTDRRPHRRPLLITADLVSAAVLLSLPLAHWLGVVTLPQLYVVGLLAGGAQVLSMSAGQSFFVAIVDREHYVAANSRLSTSRSASYVAGPTIGGFLVQVCTAPVAVLIDAASFVCSAALLSRIESPRIAVAPPASFLADVREGVAYVRGHPYLRAALGCVTTVNFFTFAAQGLAVLFASRTLGLPSGLIGLAFGIGALGGLLGAVSAPRLSRTFGAGRMVVVGAILFPAPIAVMAVAGGPHWLAVTVVAAGEVLSAAGVMVFDINLNAIQTAVIADAVRSRVSGVFSTVNYGARPLGALVGGLLGGAVGVRPTLLIAAAGGTACCLWLLRSPIPRVRDIASLRPAPQPSAARS